MADSGGLSFRDRPARTPSGTGRLVALLLLCAVGGALGRRWWAPALPPGILVEVRGDVPHPGRYLVVDPTVHRALAAAGSQPLGPDRPIAFGDRVEVRDGGVAVLPPSDPVLVGLPIDPNAADAAAFGAVPGVSRGVAEALVARREALGGFRSLQDLRGPGLPPDLPERLAPFVALPADPGPLDLNAATAAELERLDGVGPVLAARIVVERADRGPFASVDDLARVPGVGPALIERLRGRVRVAP